MTTEREDRSGRKRDDAPTVMSTRASPMTANLTGARSVSMVAATVVRAAGEPNSSEEAESRLDDIFRGNGQHQHDDVAGFHR